VVADEFGRKGFVAAAFEIGVGNPPFMGRGAPVGVANDGRKKSNGRILRRLSMPMKHAVISSFPTSV
jgi:hypothetical protein